ncbi:MAG: thioredoxin [Acidimicrobiia bacterium]
MKHVKDADTTSFPREVVQRSREVPVVVDFWAAWCGPCRVLGPLLERLAEEYQGAFELVKVDVDRSPQLASQFGVQGIPTVVGFRDGTAATRFTGALPEQALRQWLTEFLPSEADQKVEEARDAILEDDHARAEALFREALVRDGLHQEAGGGLAALLIAQGRSPEALDLLDTLSPTPEIQRLQAAARLTVAEPRGDLAELESRLAEHPDDERTRLRLAQALASGGEFEPALDHLLSVVRARGEKRDEARQAMLDIFEVLGNEHPLTQTYRRALANELF